MKYITREFFIKINRSDFNLVNDINLNPDNAILTAINDRIYHLYISQNAYEKSKLNEKDIKKFFKSKIKSVEINIYIVNSEDIVEKSKDFDYIKLIRKGSKSIKEERENKTIYKLLNNYYLIIYKKFLDLSVKLDVTIDSFIEKKKNKFIIWLDYIPPNYSGFQGYSGVKIEFISYPEQENESYFGIDFDSKYLYLKPSVIDFLKKLIKDRPISIYETIYDEDGDLEEYRKIS